jgi:hypothetical protein
MYSKPFIMWQVASGNKEFLNQLPFHHMKVNVVVNLDFNFWIEFISGASTLISYFSIFLFFLKFGGHSKCKIK